MEQASWFLVLLLIISLSVYTVRSDSRVIVRPTNSNSSICGDHATCDTLSNLISSYSTLFTDNSDLALHFLRGIHEIRSSKIQLKVKEKKNITIFGERAEIVCETPLTFHFWRIENLEIRDVRFTRCGHCLDNTNELYEKSATLLLVNIQIFRMESVKIIQSNGFGLLAINLCDYASISNSTFRSNRACTEAAFNVCEGGNIAFHFYEKKNFNCSASRLKHVNVVLNACNIEGGTNKSDTIPAMKLCMERLNLRSPFAPKKSLANGLAAIFAQNKTAVYLHINETRFVGNIGNMEHPAILIQSIIKDKTNYVEITNSFFTEQNHFIVMFKMEYDDRNKNYTTNLILTVKNCSFSNAVQTCAKIESKKPTELWQYKKSIKFLDCNFTAGIQVHNTHAVLTGCNFYNASKTAVYSKNSLITVYGQNTFQHNSGSCGGALSLRESVLLLMPKSRTFILENNASHGGGVYATPVVKESGMPQYDTLCSIVSAGFAWIHFKDNRARYAGHSIYGGQYVNCTYNCTKEDHCDVSTVHHSSQHLPPFITVTPYLNKTSLTDVSSPIDRICLCKDSKPTDKCEKIDLALFPGQEFNVSLIALGKLDGSTPVLVTTSFWGENLKLNVDKELATNCRTVSYSIPHDQTHLQLKISDRALPKITKSGVRFSFNFNWSDCPLGLMLSPNSHQCDCHSFLMISKFEIKCKKEQGLIIIKDKQWVGYYHNSHLAVSSNYSRDYLHSGDRYINLSTPDKQCNYNRSGVLCGACKSDFSMVLGTSNCIPNCNNMYLLLIIPFALAGVALVVLLLKCNLTVSVGHINGIIFYANVVQVNKALFFHSIQNQNTAEKKFTHVLSTFIAWLNLDLGMEKCFFKNMTSHSKTWLQFVFPVYLWVLILLIIVLAHYFQRLNRLIGSNSVPVLATLLLLSYAKLFRTVVEAVEFTILEIENGTHITVWRNDGNIEYFSTEHIPLFLVSLLFLVLYILPMTMLVLFASCLQARSHYKAFKWVNRLKPFLDAYQGPYTDNFRCWTGLMLMARAVPLSITYTTNFRGDPTISFFWTTATTALIIFLMLKKAKYRYRLTHYLEMISLINIVILFSTCWLTSTTVYQTWHSFKKYTTYTSSVITMLMFMGILTHQALLPLCHRKLHKLLRNVNLNVNLTKVTGHACASNVNQSENTPTFSVVELKECDQLIEPLLDTN